MVLIAYYPTVLAQSVEMGSKSATIALKIPSAVLMSAVSLTLLTLSLRYCSYCVFIDRQDKYVAALEDRLADAVGDDGLFRREGRVYNDHYPLVSLWAWHFYTLVFPAIVIVSIVWVDLASMGTQTRASIIFDMVIGACVIVAFILYKAPAVAIRLQNVKRSQQEEPDPRPLDASASAPTTDDTPAVAALVAVIPEAAAALGRSRRRPDDGAHGRCGEEAAPNATRRRHPRIDPP